MWITLILLFEGIFFYFFVGHIWKHIFSIGVVVSLFVGFGIILYILSYIDPNHSKGSRNWEWLRRSKLWQRFHKNWFPLEYHFSYHHFDKRKKYIFIVHPNPYSIALLFGLGFHGGNDTLNDLNLLWMAPKLWMRIPILRDILAWSGAIDQKIHLRDSGVIDILNKGYSVALSPEGLLDALRVLDNDHIYIKKADDDIFNFVVENESIEIVPVLVYGESTLYKNVTNDKIQRIRTYFLNKVGVPWPSFSFGWMQSPIPKKKELHVYVGKPVNSHGRQSKLVKEEFYKILETLNCANEDKPIKYVL